MHKTDPTVLTKGEERRLKEAGFTLVPGDDVGRWERLREEYFSSGLWKQRRRQDIPEFCCNSAKECDALFRITNDSNAMRPDHRGSVANYFAAGYDRLRSNEGVPIRACVVSIDSGGWTYDFESQTKIDRLNELDFCNTHWSATRELMHYLFFGEWPYRVNETLLTLKLFTHVRTLKCNGGSAPRPPLDEILACRGRLDRGYASATQWKPHPLMYRNCWHRLRAELAILQPTIIIAQGFTSKPGLEYCTTWSVIKAMNDLCGRSDADQDMARQIYGAIVPGNVAVRLWNTAWGRCVLVGSYHPAAKGLYTERGTGAVDAALRPAVEWIRRHGFAV